MALIRFNKPFGVSSQFTERGASGSCATLSDFIDLPGVYSACALSQDRCGQLVKIDDY